jgi:DNA-binding NarL/FixJ family response regulator
MMGERIRILVIDDQEIFRLGLRVSLRKFQDISLDCEAADGPTGLALVAERKPDVAIVDIWLPGMDGVEVAERIQQVSPETGIMLMSGFFDDTAIARGLQLCVDGIITKNDSPQQFACFIRRIHDGVFCFSESLAENPYVRTPDMATPDH